MKRGTDEDCGNPPSSWAIHERGRAGHRRLDCYFADSRGMLSNLRARTTEPEHTEEWPKVFALRAAATRQRFRPPDLGDSSLPHRGRSEAPASPAPYEYTRSAREVIAQFTHHLISHFNHTAFRKDAARP